MHGIKSVVRIFKK